MFQQKPKPLLPKPLLPKPLQKLEIVNRNTPTKEKSQPISERIPHQKPVKLASEEWQNIYINSKVEKIFAHQNNYYSSPESFYGGSAKNMNLVDIGKSICKLKSSLITAFHERKEVEEDNNANISLANNKDLTSNTKKNYMIGAESEKLIGQIPQSVKHFREYPQILASIQTPPYSQMDAQFKVDTVFVLCPENTSLEMRGKVTFLLQSMIYNLVSTFEIGDYSPFSYIQTAGSMDKELIKSQIYQDILKLQNYASTNSEAFHLALQAHKKSEAKILLKKHNDYLEAMLTKYEEIFEKYGVALEFKGIQVKTSPAGKNEFLSQNSETGVLLPPTKAMMYYKDFYTNNISTKGEVQRAWDRYLDAFESVIGLKKDE